MDDFFLFRYSHDGVGSPFLELMSECKCQLVTYVSGFGQKWGGLAPNGLTEPDGTGIWSEKVTYLSHLEPIWPTLEPNLISLVSIFYHLTDDIGNFVEKNVNFFEKNVKFLAIYWHSIGNVSGGSGLYTVHTTLVLAVPK